MVRVKAERVDSPPLIDTTTAAARLDRPERTVRDWCVKQRHPCHRAEQLGGKWMIPEADIPGE